MNFFSKKGKEKRKKETWYLQPWKRKSNTNLYIGIFQKINENNHLKLSYNPKYKEKEDHVRLNLFNHVLALFRAKFACNLAIRYLVFRWDLCEGSV